MAQPTTTTQAQQQQQHKKTKGLTTQSSNSLTFLITDQQVGNKPIGVSAFGYCFRFKSQASKRCYHQILVLLLTFIAYAAFHMSRRPLSVVKNVLNRDCSRVKPKNLSLALLDEVATAAATTFLVTRDPYQLLQQQQQQQQQQQHPSDNNILAPPSINPYTNTYDYDEPYVTSTTTISPFASVYNTARQQSTISPISTSSPIASFTGNQQVVGQQILTKDTSCDWAPFDNDETANKLLAVLDTSFLLSYAIFMFFSGFVAERTNLRYFISVGSLISGLGLIAFGMSYSLDIHSMAYFVIIQIISGAAQTTGWPVVVTCVSNWFDRSKLGTIYGLWNSHTNLGNILGATIAGYFVESDWGLSFIVPGLLMIIVGLILFLFLVPTPEDVNLSATLVEHQDGNSTSINNNNDTNDNNNSTQRRASATRTLQANLTIGHNSSDNNRNFKVNNNNNQPLELTSSHKSKPHNQSRSTDDYDGFQYSESGNNNNNNNNNPRPSKLTSTDSSGDEETITSEQSKQLALNNNNKPISFMRALCIPGVIEYSFCLFFSKLVSYTFLYWLPRYITSSTSFNSQDSAYLSTPFDVGGIAGSIMAGWLSDRFKVNGIICNIMLILAIPSMFIYQQFGSLSSWHNILLQLLVGSLVNGPYCLITTAVSADLGNRIKDGHAMATVSAIIDGMGSLGAVLGPLFAGFVSSKDWRSVFTMLMVADVWASLCIVRVTVQDVRRKFFTGGAKNLSPKDANSVQA